MSLKTRAAVVRETNQLTIETIELDAPKANEVLVRVRAAGVCHSDLHNLRGELRLTPPFVMGHEGAGIVEQVGANVTHVKPGDRVLINWLPADGICPACLRGQPNVCERLFATTFQGWLPDGTSRLKTLDGVPLKHLLSAATMSEHIVIDQASAIPFSADVPFEVAAIIGCAVVTGVGAVINTARVHAGSSAAVIGCGGVGLSAILGCQLAGCHPIIAVDVLASKLEFARRMGATHTINAKETDAVKALRALVRGGPDYVFDTVGSPATISQALQAVRAAGTAVVAGLHAARLDVPIPAGALVLQNKSLLGSFAGSLRAQIDLPRLVELYRARRLPLDGLITQRYSLAELEQAFADMEAGVIARGVIVFE
ncbi:MAG: Zn-dependent alcohol dehydrogenase [Chloroflexota bacterium]|nr:Zn-dependent alcohol dehydrogenase [Chloroflexota bacterium]